MSSNDLPQPPPPPPTALVPPPPAPQFLAPIRPYRSGRTLAGFARAAFVLTIVTAGFDLAANVDAAQLLGRLEADAGAVTLADLDAVDLRTGASGLLLGVCVVAAFGLLVAWTSRLYRNLPSLGVHELRFGEGWAIGAWFVPLLNLVRPKQILNDIWRGSGPPVYTGDDWRQRPVTHLLHWWWGVWIAASVLGFGTLSEPADLSAAQQGAVRSAVVDVLFMIVGVLAIVVVARLTDRQEGKAGRVAEGHRTRWLPVAALGLGLAVIAFGGTLAGFTAADEREPVRPGGRGAAPSTSSPRVTDRGRRTVLPLDLRPGDCLTDSGDVPGAGPATTILAVNVVDCGTPHEEEVVGRVTHPAGAGSEYPGDASIIEHADAGCADEFESWVGRSYAESALVLAYLVPRDEAWDIGERTIICVVSLPGGEPLTASARGSGR